MKIQDGRICTIDVLKKEQKVYLTGNLSIIFSVSKGSQIIDNGRLETIESNQVHLHQGTGFIELKNIASSLVIIQFSLNFTQLWLLNDRVVICDDNYRKKIEYQNLISQVSELINIVSLNNNDDNLCEIKCMTIMQYIVDNFSQKIKDRTLSIDNIITYLKLNYRENLDLNNVADIFGITPQYLSKYFKQNSGNNFREVLNKIRVEDAATRLTTDNKSTIINIAYDSGFTSVSTFSLK